MMYIVKAKGINVASDKRWLTRHNYSKLAIKAYGALLVVSQPSDEAMATKLKVSLRTYREAKRELVFAGLLEIYKINSNTIVMVIGDKAIKAYADTIKNKEDSRIISKTWEYLDLDTTVIEEDEIVEDLTSYTDIQKIKEIIPTPSPLNPNYKLF